MTLGGVIITRKRDRFTRTDLEYFRPGEDMSASRDIVVWIATRGGFLEISVLVARWVEIFWNWSVGYCATPMSPLSFLLALLGQSWQVHKACFVFRALLLSHELVCWESGERRYVDFTQSRHKCNFLHAQRTLTQSMLGRIKLLPDHNKTRIKFEKSLWWIYPCISVKDVQLYIHLKLYIPLWNGFLNIIPSPPIFYLAFFLRSKLRNSFSPAPKRVWIYRGRTNDRKRRVKKNSAFPHRQTR